MSKMKNREKTKEQLQEDLRKAQEEVAIQKWGVEKTLDGMKALIKELVQKGKEAEEQKGELAGRVKELEELNKVMVGRELRMTELKKEIEQLKAATQKV